MSTKHSGLFFLVVLSFFVITLVFVTAPLAQANPTCGGGGTSCVTLENPISVSTFPDLLAKVLDILIKILIPIAALCIMYSGFLYLQARGKPGEIEKAHKAILYTLLGTAIILGAFVISTALQKTIDNLKSSMVESPSTLTLESQSKLYE